MELVNNLLIFLFLSIYNVSITGEPETKKLYKKTKAESEEDYKVFEPTSEWQPLRKDEAIPRGLHVRLNLATGEREAKLLDPEEEEVGGEIVASSKDEGQEPLTHEQLHHYLSKLSADQPLHQEDVERVRKKVRSYEELKEELAGVGREVKTEAEILNDLLEKYRDITSGRNSDEEEEDPAPRIVALLTDMEYLVHQIDNAKLFIKHGLREVILPSLNSTNEQVRYEAARLLGSAVQNNPSAQVSAVEGAAVSALLRSLATDASYKVKTGVVYALSCLLRRFPAAQAQFLNKGGLSAFEQFFHGEASHQIKLRSKMVSMVKELLVESGEDHGDVTRALQYRVVDLARRLAEAGWCDHLALFLTTISSNLHPEPDQPLHPAHALLTDTAQAMTALREVCSERFSDEYVRVAALLQMYNDLVKGDKTKDNEESVFSEVRGVVAGLLHSLSKHDEL